jgi:carboxylesterase
VQYEIKPGCEAWTAAGSGPNADIGVLLLHGFTGSPASMRPWAEDLHQRGFTIEMPRLPGHGTDWRELNTMTWQDLARATVAAFEDLRSRTRSVVVMGLSNGALLALRLAQTRGDDLAGIVLVNPFVYTLDPRAKLLPILKLVLPSFPGVINDIAKPDMDELGYDRLPLRAVASMTQLQKIVQAKLAEVRVPTLLFTSRQDHVLGEKAHQKLAAALMPDDYEHVWLERSYHVATLDFDYPVILEGSAKFAERVASTPS